MVAIDFEVLPVGERRARRGRAGRAAGAQRHSEQHRAGGADKLRRRRRRIRPRGACVRGRDLGASRRRHGDGDARRGRDPRSGDRHADGVVVDADAASRPPHARRPVRARSRIDPRDRARCRRRLRAEGAVLSGGGGDPGGGDEARPAGEMVRGPARAFPVRDPGARPVLEGRDRGRQGRQAARRSAAACCTTPARSRRGASSCPTSPR